MDQALHLKNTQAVAQWFDHCKHPLKEAAVIVHQAILDSDPLVAQHIKWNAPAYYYAGEMPPFDPKTYARDIVVFNIHKNDHLLLIFPTGARIPDNTGLLGGKFPDTRKSVKITTTEEAEKAAEDLKTVIRLWIAGIGS